MFLSCHGAPNRAKHNFGDLLKLMIRLAHTLNVETASWEDGISPVCTRCPRRQSQDEVHVLFMRGYEGAGVNQPQADQPSNQAEGLPM
eukprot:1161266-Pelagomonas_calceolata.AAC.14